MYSSRGRGHLRADAGASAVEFALILPLLALFLFGTVEFGLAFARAQGMEASAREAGRLAALGRTVQYSDVLDAAQNAAPVFVTPSDIEVEVNGDTGAVASWCDSTPIRDETVEVIVRIAGTAAPNYALTIPLWRGANEGLDFESVAVFQCEARRTATP